MSERFLRLKEVQNVMGVSRSTVWRWHTEHGLRVVRVGGVTRIRESDLQAFLKRHETKLENLQFLAKGTSEIIENGA
jgi:excisionase family DNA binding protein